MELKFEPNWRLEEFPDGARGSNRRAGFVFVDEVEIGTLSRLIPVGVEFDLVGRLCLGDLLLRRDEIEAM